MKYFYKSLFSNCIFIKVFFLFSLLFISKKIDAQVAGDYRTNASNATFSSNANWDYFNGTQWVTATSASKPAPANVASVAASSVAIAGNTTNNYKSTIGVTAATTTFSGTATTFNNITINSGANFTHSNVGISIVGNLINNGTFTGSSATTTFSGTTSITTTGSPTFNFNSLTISGALTAYAGIMSISGTYTNNGFFTNNNGTINFTGTGANNIAGSMTGSNAFNHVNINASNTYTFTSSGDINGNLTIATGATLKAPTGILTIKGNLSLAGTGVFTHNGGTVTFSPSTTSTISGGTFTFNVLNINTGIITVNNTCSIIGMTTVANGATLAIGAAITFSGGSSVLGSLQMNANGSLSTSPNFGTNSTLIYNTAGAINRGTEWNSPVNVTINNGTSLSMGAQSQALTVSGNLMVNGGFTLSTTASPNGDLYLQGDWNHANSGATIVFNSSNIVFSGSGNSNITNSGGGSETFSNLTIDKSSSGTLTLNSPVTVSNQLTLSSGIVNTTSANILTINNTASTSISGSFSASTMINGPLAWKMPSSSSSVYLFPVGSGTAYYPLSFSNGTASNSSTVISVKAVVGSTSGSPDNSTVSALSVTEYWSTTSSGGNITGGTLSLNRDAQSIAQYNLIAKSSTLTGTYSSFGGTPSGTSINGSNSLTLSVGSTAYLVLGLYSTTPTISGITGGATSSIGYFGQLLTINGANFVPGTTVSFNGVGSLATTFVSTTQVKIAVPANATSGNITATVNGIITNGYPYSILGYISAQSGDWSNPATWAGGAVPPRGAAVTIAHSVTVNNANYAASVANLTIASGGSISFSSSDTLYISSLVNNGTITMTSGGVVALTGTTPTFTNNGTFTYGIGTVAMNGTVSNTVTGQNNFYNINVGGVAILCNDTLYGNLTVAGTGSYSCDPVGAGSLPTYGAGQTVNIYASPNGSGVGSGASFSLPVNLARTIVVAQNYPNNPVNVLLKDGTYYQLTLTSADARTASAPAIYIAINKGKAIFQPLKVINRADFQPIPDSVKQRIIDPTAKGKVMQLNLATYNINSQSVTPWATVVNNTPKYPIFYQNTTPLMLSRYPNDTTMSMNGVIYKGTNKTDSGGIFYYSDTRTNRWVNAMNDEGVWLAGNWRVSFVIQYIKTKTIDTINKIIYQKDGVQLGIGNKFVGYAGNYKEPYYVANLFEEIDTVGEFSVNFNNKMLYMWVPDTGTIQYADSLTMPAISATGASYTQFQNINFVGGASNAIAINSANHIRIAGCDFTQCTDDAIVLNDVTYTTVQSNDIHQVGAGGVAMFNNSYNTDINTLKRGYDTVINNYFYDYAQQTPLYNAAIDPGGCIGVYVANNKVRKCPHIGIAYGFGGGDLSTFEYNEVDSVVLVYSDMGALYGTGVWKDRGHKFNHNYLHDILGANGLYLDNNTSGDTCVYNIVANSIWGMGNNGGNYNRFYNNIFVNQAKPAVGNYTADTIIDFVRNYPVIKSLWYSNPAWQSTFPELIDLVDSVNGVNKSFTSQYWSQMKNNTFFTFGPNFAGQTLAYVNDNSLFNADGSTNNTYAQTGDPFVRWGTVFQNNYKVYNKLKNPVYPFLMDSLRSPGLLTYAGATDWHINRIGVYIDSFRTDISSIGVKGISPYINLAVNSTTNHILPDTSIVTARVVLPNASNCFSSIQFYDNGTALKGLTVNKTTVSYDTVTYAITYTGAALGNHSITCKLTDAPYWQYTSTPFTFTTDSAMTWTGNTSTDWSTASNWSNNRTPLSTDVVTIPGSVSRMPVINNGTKKVKRFTLKAGSSLTLQNSTDTLAVTGDIQSTGTFSGNGVLESLSTTTTPLSAGQNWGVTVYYGASGQMVVSGNYTKLDLSGGNSTLSNTGTIAVSGDMVLGSTTVGAGTSTVLFNGSGTQTIGGSVGFYNLQVNKSGVVNPLTLGGAVTISNNLILNIGRIVSTASNLLTISNAATSAVTTVGAAAYVDGPLSWNVVAGSNSYIFPVGDYNGTSQYLPDTITTVANAGIVTVTAYKGTSGGTYNATLTSISTAEYWSVQSSVANTIAMTVAPANLATNTVIGQSNTTNGVYSSVGGSATQTSIASSGIVLAINTPAWFVDAYYPNPTITSVVSCLPSIAAGTFFLRDTLTITGNYFQTSTNVIVGGQAATVLTAQSTLPTMIKVLVSITASTGVVKVGSTSFNGNYVAGYVTRYDGKWNDGSGNNPSLIYNNYSVWLGGVQPPNSTSAKDTITINNAVTMATSVSGIQTFTINAGASYTTSNVGTSFNSGATLTNNGTYSSGNNNTYTNLSFINNGKTTLGGQSYVNVNLTNNTGDSIIISSSSVTMSGTITNNGYFKHTATAFYLNGSIAFNGSNVDTINSITTNSNATGTITFTTAPYLTGNFSLNSAFTVTGNYPTYNGNLYYNTGATQPVGSEWKPNASSGAGIPLSVQIGNGTVGSSVALTSGNSYKNTSLFSVSNGCSFTVPSTTVVQSNGLKVIGTVNISDGGQIQSSSTATINTTGTLNVGSATLSAPATTASNASLLVTSGSVNDTGVVNNYGYIKMSASNFSLLNTGSLSMQANAVLELANTSPGIPTTNWDANSYLYLTGITTSNPANISQTFGNVIWNCIGQSSNLTIAGFNTITNSFVILNSGSFSLQLNNASNTYGALQIGGSYTVNSSTINSTKANLNLGISTTSATQVNGNITVGINGILAAGTAVTSLALTGNWSDAGTFTNANTTIIFNSNSATTQTISKTSGETFNNLTINTAGTVSLGNTLNVLGTVTSLAGTLASNGYLTLISNSAGTARVNQVSGSITGNVIVQRYIPAKTARKYSFIGSSVSQLIRGAWQQQVYISGSGTGGAVCGSTTGDGGSTDKYNSNGFDRTSGNSPSMYTYAASPVNGSLYISVPNTEQTNLTPGIGYSINIRGNRNSGTVICANQLGQANPTAPEAVTLSAAGTLTTGDVHVALNNPATHAYTLIANPYPSQISYTAFQTSNSSIINNKMWTFSPFGNGNFSTYSQGAIANGATGYDNTHGDYIASGQAFFVQENISGSVVFHENHKVSGTIPNTQYFGSDNGQSIRLDLNAANNIRLDEIVVRFNGEGSKHYDANWDAESFSNANQTLTSIKDGISMAIATRPINLTMDTVPLRVRSNATGSFILDTTAITGFDSSAFVQLNDNFLHAQQDIITIPSYSFNITSDTLSSNGGRFQLLINRPTSTLPVTFTNINGRLINDKAFIDWTVASEANTISYQVEKSIDGIHYATIVTIKATGLKAYHAVDSTPSAAINYYRIKTIDGGGSTYSRTIQLDNSAAINRYVKIFPTVISSKVLMVQFGNMPAGNYQVVMKDMLGRTIYGKEIQNTGAINTQSMLLNKINPAVGVYEVQVLKDGKRFAQDRVVVE